MIIAKIETRKLAVNGPWVMIVDDEQDIRDALCETLERLSYRVSPATSGLDALKQLRQGARPAVILLDLMMPDMDGYQTLVELRRDNELSKIPVLVITAAGDARSEANKVQAAGYLQKPCSSDEIIESIERVIVR